MTKNKIPTLILVTITILFGLHFIRVFLAGVIWYLGASLAPEMLALFALGIFALALVLPILIRLLGEKGTLIFTIGGVILVRLILQIVDSGQLHLITATFGVILWSWFVPFWHQSIRNRADVQTMPISLWAFPLAFLIDTSSRSLLWSYDFVWRQDFWSLLTLIFLVVLGMYLLWAEIRKEIDIGQNDEPILSHSLPFLGFGVFLYLALSLFHNPSAWIAATGWKDINAHLVTNLFVVLGVLRLVWGAYWPSKQRWLMVILCGIGLTISLALLILQVAPGWLWLGIGTLTMWGVMGAILTGTARRSPLKPGLWRNGLAMFLALMIVLTIIFLVAQFEMMIMTIVAGAILLLTGVWAAVGNEAALKRDSFHRTLRSSITLGVIVMVCVGIWAFANRQDFSVMPHQTNQPLRIMTYNIHQGIDADLKMDLEAIVAAIQSEQPDILILNEVNRSRATNGYTEVLSLISVRTGMPYILGNNYADGQYGNALLTKLPVLEWENFHFQNNTNETRGVLRVVLDTSGGAITLYATHLDHIASPEDVRFEQVGEVLALWSQNSRSILLGDLNATPDTPEIQQIYAAGFIDVLQATNQADAFTFWEPATPGYRIDYIFVTPDLEFGDAWVPQTRASDHLPIV
ncbi:MAG: endonuclease/exonuclease/phosphatase family protein, partial [Chloroflexota bacterium]